MKKILFVLTISLISISGFSQIGFNISLVSVTPKASAWGLSQYYKNAKGLQTGVYFTSVINNVFAILQEVNITSCSNKSDNYQMGFLNIPILGVFSILKKIKLGAGPQLDYPGDF